MRSGGLNQGSSVALSADGNTAIVGGPSDDGGHPGANGAAWVYTRSGGVWTQQGSKLVGSGAVGQANQGSSVALSADGNTAIVGGCCDNAEIGAAWVYTRSNGVWTQQGSKLVGTGVVGGAADQGSSVALSADGNTAIVGGYGDNNYAGAAWVYTRSNGVWTQQGSKLVGTGAVGNFVSQGSSVSLSGDGNTAIVGGPNDNLSGAGPGECQIFCVRGFRDGRNVMCSCISRSPPSNAWWPTKAGQLALSRPLAAEGGGRRPAFTGLAGRPYSCRRV
jgi:hypothetical protein